MVGRDGGGVWETRCGDEKGVCSHPVSLCVGAWKAEKGIGFSGDWRHRWLFSSHAVHALERERMICSGGDLNFFAFFESPGVGAPIMTR